MKLKAESRFLAVATSKPTVYSERILEHFKLKKFLQLIIGSNLDGTRVAKTDVIREVVSGLPTIPKESIIMVGDREHDIIGAKNNLIASVGVIYGYGSEDELKSAGADYLAESIAELEKILLLKS